MQNEINFESNSNALLFKVSLSYNGPTLQHFFQVYSKCNFAP